MNTGEFFDTVESLYPDWQYDHPRVLYSLIKLLRPKVVVEMGTFMGYGACYMARALSENKSGHLHCVDSWQLPLPKGRQGSVKELFQRNLATLQLAPFVTLIEGDSMTVPLPKEIDFAYIDGWHSYRHAYSDAARVIGLGARCVCFDDALSVIGPRMVVDEISTRDIWEVARLPSAAGLAICQRKDVNDEKPITFSQELPNNPGVVIASKEELRRHIAEAVTVTAVDYTKYL